MRRVLGPRAVRVLEGLERVPTVAVLGSAALLVAGVAVLDWLTPVELSLAVFHAVPVSLVAWRVGRRTGLAFGFAAAASWFLADTLHPGAPPDPWIAAWDVATKVLFFVVISELVAALRAVVDLVREEARTDELTGLLNRRAFYERADEEVGRARRSGSPLVLAYVDVDAFKSVNDRFGHETGDRVLVVLARALTRSVRHGDVVARLGGDEFAVLFLDSDVAAVEAMAAKLEDAVSRDLEELGVGVGFSLGLAEWTVARGTLDELLGAADAVMYRVKSDRKGRASVVDLAPGGTP